MNRYFLLVLLLTLPLLAWGGDVPRSQPTRFIEQFKSGQTYFVKDTDVDRWTLILLDEAGRAALKNTLTETQLETGTYKVEEVGLDWIQLKRLKNKTQIDLPVNSIAQVVRWNS